MEILFEIGKKYRYKGLKKHFKLIGTKNTTEGIPYIFYFEGGHWCTETIFINLIEVSSGLYVWEQKQLKLKLN